MNYLFHIIVMINIYVVLALSLNLVVGYGGLLSLCHAAFYGIGAYASTLLVMKAGFGYLPAVASGVLIAMLFSLLISIPSLRLKGDYLALASLGFQIIVFTVLYNWTSVTNGSFGITGIPRPTLFGFEVRTLPQWVGFSTAFAVVCGGLLYMIQVSPFGRALKAMRDDELAAAALGKNIVWLKVRCFAIGAGIAAVPGALFAGYMRYIDPTSFTLMEAIFILSIIIIGGTGNMVGPILGSVLLISLPEALRFVGMPDGMAANMRQILYGLAMILVLRFRPSGLAGEYDLK